MSADKRAQEFAHSVLKVADLSPSQKRGLLRNGLANLLAWVLERDPDSGVPTREIRGRPSPFGLIPVKYATGGGGGTGARGGAPETLGLAATVTHVERADQSAAYPLLSLMEAKLLRNLSTPIVQLERTADGLVIARSGPWSRLLRVVGDTPCLALIDSKNDPWHVAYEDGSEYKERPQTDVEIWAKEMQGGGPGAPGETTVVPIPGGGRGTTTVTPGRAVVETGIGGGAADEDGSGGAGGGGTPGGGGGAVDAAERELTEAQDAANAAGPMQIDHPILGRIDNPDPAVAAAHRRVFDAQEALRQAQERAAARGALGGGAGAGAGRPAGSGAGGMVQATVGEVVGDLQGAIDARNTAQARLRQATAEYERAFRANSTNPLLAAARRQITDMRQELLDAETAFNAARSRLYDAVRSNPAAFGEIGPSFRDAFLRQLAASGGLGIAGTTGNPRDQFFDANGNLILGIAGAGGFGSPRGAVIQAGGRGGAGVINVFGGPAGPTAAGGLFGASGGRLDYPPGSVGYENQYITFQRELLTIQAQRQRIAAGGGR